MIWQVYPMLLMSSYPLFCRYPPHHIVCNSEGRIRALGKNFLLPSSQETDEPRDLENPQLNLCKSRLRIAVDEKGGTVSCSWLCNYMRTLDNIQTIVLHRGRNEKVQRRNFENWDEIKSENTEKIPIVPTTSVPTTLLARHWNWGL